MATPFSILTIERAPCFALKVACKMKWNDTCQCLLTQIADRLLCSPTTGLLNKRDCQHIKAASQCLSAYPQQNKRPPLETKATGYCLFQFITRSSNCPGSGPLKQPPGLVQVRSIFSSFEGGHPIPRGLLIYRKPLTCLDAPTKRSLPVRRQWWQLGGARNSHFPRVTLSRSSNRV
jgi:hypothetical protein